MAQAAQAAGQTPCRGVRDTGFESASASERPEATTHRTQRRPALARRRTRTPGAPAQCLEARIGHVAIPDVSTPA